MNVMEIDTHERELTPGTRVHARFPARWSPRAMSGEALDRAEIDTLLEAARWAPSCFNAQPWRFAWVTPTSPGWQRVFDSLVEGNRSWAVNAGALFAVASRCDFEHNGKPNDVHAFDAGAAWMSLALQAADLGLVAHGMRGFDLDTARAALQLPEGFALHAIVAVGHPGERESLPEALQARETPSPRKALTGIAFENDFAGLDA